MVSNARLSTRARVAPRQPVASSQQPVTCNTLALSVRIHDALQAYIRRKERMHYLSSAPAREPAALRVSFAEAFDLGPDVWDRLMADSGSASPFLSWAWHRACASAVPPQHLDACQAVVLRSATGDVDGMFPFRVQRDRFWGIPVTSVDWAFGDLGCPDHRELLTSP